MHNDLRRQGRQGTVLTVPYCDLAAAYCDLFRIVSCSYVALFDKIDPVIMVLESITGTGECYEIDIRAG